jgi:signal transduction histidine kinase
LRSYLALAGGLLALPLLPGAYFYAAYRRQLGGLELRANRVISLYLFFLVLGVVFAILLPLAEALPDFPTRLTLIGLGSAALVAFLALFAFGPFQRFVERRLLGMPLAQSRLLETYAAEITVSLNTSRLVTLLQEKILPSLLVRQSALLRFDGPVHTTLYAAGVDPAQLPAPESIPDLLALAGKYRAPAKDGAQPCSWARLVLPLAASQQSIGVWLLGRRDPDDFYSQAEIPTLQSLAHQTAVALINIVQAERLHALYQTDIDRAETERAALARRLHDHLLNELAVLKLSMGDYTPPPEFLNRYEALTADLRQIVSGLRPPMLGYGLHPALSALVSAATERTAPGLSVLLELPETDMRYDPQVERHLYRIVQQSVDNALRHAQAGRVVIKGRLEADRIALSIEDDGIGFATGEQLDVAGFVAHKHFGLAGMLERAALVNATMQIESAPGRGTRVGVTWAR